MSNIKYIYASDDLLVLVIPLIKHHNQNHIIMKVIFHGTPFNAVATKGGICYGH